jgi:hypothetical protein
MNPLDPSAAPARGAPTARGADIANGLRRGLLLGLAVATLTLPPQRPANEPPQHAQASTGIARVAASQRASGPRFAHLGAHAVSDDARFLADWVADSQDHGGGPFVIVDKRHAAVLVFDGNARLVARTPVLLGSAAGDDTVPGIGSRPLELVRPEERTTPAGRFVAERGRNTLGEDVVWIDYDAAVSMHRVRTLNPAERRQQRLDTPTPDDNRISYGCINVPVGFFEAHIQPVFAQRRALVYVLPEQRTLQQVFGAYDVAARHGLVRALTTEHDRAGPPSRG